MRDEIRSAIEQRRLLSFTYDGHPRTVVPAALGTAKRKRTAILHAYQVGGGSSRGGLPNWRFFYTEKMTDFRLLDQTFAADPPGWAPSALESVEISLPVTARPAGDEARRTGRSGPPGTERAVTAVLGAVGRWFRTT